MPDLKISELTAWTPLETDVIPYVDLVAWETKKALKSELKWDTWDAATVDAWTTATWVEWTNASVVNSGSTSAAIFDFTIPRWDTGAIWAIWATGATWDTWADGADWVMASVVWWTNITVDATDPANPIVNWSGWGAIWDPVTWGITWSVLFVDGSWDLWQDNPNFFWDDTNNRLGIWTATPVTSLNIDTGFGIANGVTFGDWDSWLFEESANRLLLQSALALRLKSNAGSASIFMQNGEFYPETSIILGATNRSFVWRGIQTNTLADNNNGLLGINIWTPTATIHAVGQWSTSATTTINAVNSTAWNLLKITDEWAAYFGHSNQMIFNGTGNLTITGNMSASAFNTDIINSADNTRSLLTSQDGVTLKVYDWAWTSTMEVKWTEVGIWVAPNQKLTIEWTMDLKEQASANTDTAWYGQLWIRNDTANTPMFTDDAGTDGTLSRLEFAQEYTKAQNFNATSLTSWAAIAWDLESNQVTKLTLATNGTLSNPTNLVDWATYILTVIQDATGSRTLAYWTAYKFPWGTAPTLSTAANSVDILTLISDGTNMYWVSQLDFS